MKKKLREQLRLLAQQIIEKEETFKTTQIKKSVLDLFNQLVILEYLENQIGNTPEDSHEESLDSKSFREENWFKEPEPVPQPTHKEDLVEPLMEKIKDIVAQMPEGTQHIDDLLDTILLPEKDVPTPSEVEHTTWEEKPTPSEVVHTPSEVEHTKWEEKPTPSDVKAEEKPATQHVRNELEEFASSYQQMPEFERKDPQLFPPSTGLRPASKNVSESRSKSINDSINKGLNVGLNDRLAFIKHLFEGQTEDYTRVLSQINTMSSFEEAERFILENVKPDYKHWQNKEKYSDRFMIIIEKNFI